MSVRYEVLPVRGVDCVLSDAGLVPLANILRWDGLERLMASLPQAEAPVEHIFSGGVYIRQMMIPAGTFIIGKRHRRETCNILMSGELSVCTDGGPVSRLQGPLVLTSESMARKIAYAHTDVVFMNLHPTDSTDLEAIEAEFIIPEEEFIKLQKEINPCLGEL